MLILLEVLIVIFAAFLLFNILYTIDYGESSWLQ